LTIALTLSAVRDETGCIVGMSGITRDVTAETQIRAALVAQRAPVPARFDQTQVPQAMLAQNGTLVAVNDAYCRLLGRDRSETRGTACAAPAPPERRWRAARSARRHTGRSDRGGHLERILAGRDGVAVPVMINAALAP
jgi:PAS domain S-box-containing protein